MSLFYLPALPVTSDERGSLRRHPICGLGIFNQALQSVRRAAKSLVRQQRPGRPSATTRPFRPSHGAREELAHPGAYRSRDEHGQIQVIQQ